MIIAIIVAAILTWAYLVYLLVRLHRLINRWKREMEFKTDYVLDRSTGLVYSKFKKMVEENINPEDVKEMLKDHLEPESTEEAIQKEFCE